MLKSDGLLELGAGVGAIGIGVVGRVGVKVAKELAASVLTDAPRPPTGVQSSILSLWTSVTY